MSRIASAAVAVGLLLGVAPAPVYAGDGDVVATITDDRITESSALVQSTVDPSLAYTINDSGNETVVYVIKLSSGKVVGTTTLDVDALDTEAMAIGADNRLYVGDIGDNDHERKRVVLYAIDQPGRGPTRVTPEAYRIRYRDGPSDAETLLVDPITGRMSIVTKGVLGGGVYRLPLQLRSGRANVASPILGIDVPGLVTDGSYLPDGSGVLLRTYGDVVAFKAPDWSELGSIETRSQPQSESLATWGSQRSVLVGTEKLPSTIVEVRIPNQVWARLHGGPSRDGEDPVVDDSSTDEAGEPGPGGGWMVVSGAIVVLLAAAWVFARRRR